MPLLDHFHRPLIARRPWEAFHHAWATVIAQQLNKGLLPAEYYAIPERRPGPEFEVDVGTYHEKKADWNSGTATSTAVWAPAAAKINVAVSYAHLDSYEVRVYQDVGGAELRAAIELVSPANKDRPMSRQTFAAKCAGYVKHGIGVVIVDVVTTRTANLHNELIDALEVKSRRALWESESNLYTVAYRPVTIRKRPRLEIWPEPLVLGQTLPVMPLWLSLDLCVPLRLEESYVATCESLRIPVSA